MATKFPVVVHERRVVAERVISLELRPTDDILLPEFQAGSHIDVHLPLPSGELVRQYSICNNPAERDRYVIGIALDVNSRGGSAAAHHVVKGQRIFISVPRNNFRLEDNSATSILVAGGIGVTPLLSMARELSVKGRPWRLYYCARAPRSAAFLDELQALDGEVIPVFDGVPGIASLNLRDVIDRSDEGTHFYCCGPTGLIQAFLEATSSLDPKCVHVEWFAPAKQDISQSDNSFVVNLARAGYRLNIPADKSILDVVLAEGIDHPYSCQEGICGLCEVKVLEGTCDHRDLVTSEEDRADGKKMMICVSRARSAVLTLDL